jgi:hypothetical protein
MLFAAFMAPLADAGVTAKKQADKNAKRLLEQTTKKKGTTKGREATEIDTNCSAMAAVHYSFLILPYSTSYDK